MPLGLFLDLSKAFDSVSHKILIQKLEACGIRGNQLKLLTSYLQNRKQKVKIEIEGKNYISDDETVGRGVPQGSILGPLLFVLYINDFPNTLNCCSSVTAMFADDCSAVVAHKNINESIHMAKTTLKRTENWCDSNKLILNTKKTECVLFFTTSKANISLPSELLHENYSIKINRGVKFLGVQIDCNLKWEDHVVSLNKKLNSVIYQLNVLRQQVDKETMLTVYHANFASLASYGLIFWGGGSCADRIFKTQKRALRSILRLGFKESCRGHFVKNNILTLTGLYIYKCLKFMNEHPNLFEEFLNQNNTRRIIKYNYPRCRLTLSQKSCEYMCIKIANTFPSSLFGGGEFRMKEAKKFLIKAEPYSLEEFRVWCRKNTGL